MGCFSFICKECGNAILSNSFTGQDVKLFLLKDSEVIDSMEGKYDSYGRVFEEDLKSSKEWNIEWSDVCELMFNNNDSNGIAAVHSKCFHTIPKSRSMDDPNQGWGDDWELFGDHNSERPL
jgi:hypothetical protein